MFRYLIYLPAKFLFFTLSMFIISCAPSKEVRYEKTPKEEKKVIETPPLYKTMEARERDLFSKLKISEIDRIGFDYNDNKKLINNGKLSTTKYDKNGYLVETFIYNSKGKITDRFDYKYSPKGDRMESVRYNYQNQPDKKYTYTYDADGNKTKARRFSISGSLEKYYLYEYDKYFNLVSERWYDVSGDLEFKIENDYDEFGNKTDSFSYDRKGNLLYRYVYKYDQNNMLIEEQKYNSNDELAGIIQYLYKYF